MSTSAGSISISTVPTSVTNVQPPNWNNNDDVLPSFPRIRQHNLDVLYGSSSNSNRTFSKDKSRMGHVDPHIQDLVDYINHCTNSNYVTLSSCSGRIAIFHPAPVTQEVNTLFDGDVHIKDEHAIDTLQYDSTNISQKEQVESSEGIRPQEGGYCEDKVIKVEPTTKTLGIADVSRLLDTNNNDNTKSSGKGNIGSTWLFVSHDIVSDPQTSIVPLFFPLETVSTINNKIIPSECTGICYLKFEPMLLHVAACNLLAGQNLLQWALQNGLRESGIVMSSQRITVALRTTSLSLSIPLSFNAHHIFFPKSKEYLIALIKECNRRLLTNLQLIGKLLTSLQQVNFVSLSKSLSTTPENNIFDKDKKEAMNKPPYELLRVMLSTPKCSSTIPSINLYGHSVIDLLISSTNKTAGTMTRQILLFGGYGHGPLAIRKSEISPSPVNQQLHQSRSTNIYRLHGQYNETNSEAIRWTNLWEEVDVATLHDTIEPNSVKTVRIFATYENWAQLDDSKCMGSSIAIQVQPSIWDGRLFGTAINLSNTLGYSTKNHCYNEEKLVVLLFGGRYGPNKPMNDILLFEYSHDAKGKIYTPNDVQGTKPTPRWGHSFTMLNNDQTTINSLSTLNHTIPIGLLVGGRTTHGVNTDSCFVLSLAQSDQDSKSEVLYHFLWEPISMKNDHLLRRFYHTSTSLVHATSHTIFVFGGLSRPDDLLETFTQNEQENGSFSYGVSVTYTHQNNQNYIELLPITMNVASRFGHTATCCTVTSKTMQLNANLMTTQSTDCTGLIMFVGGVQMDTQQSHGKHWMECLRFLVSDGKLSMNSAQVDVRYKDNDAKTVAIFDPGVKIHHCCVPLLSPTNTKNINQGLDLLFIGGGVSGYAFQPLFAPSHQFTMEWCYDHGGRGMLSLVGEQSTVNKIEEVRHLSSTTPITIEKDHGVSMCDVIYVLKPNAKLVKSELEKLLYIDKRFRMTIVDSKGIIQWDNNTELLRETMTTVPLLDYIAIPIAPRFIHLFHCQASYCIDSIDSNYESLYLRSLIAGYGRQICLKSTTAYARGSS